ncbi:glycosyltransferase [uncultured Paludibaculum sp.]|uniref:glycosyltransferase n=1 Tax=uncultured Paludibaculum sp. TaxID=1765020 RepID=UPI002AAB6CB2|nr:glycosyltransferase [uncultured Paludibaculum sp.]
MMANPGQITRNSARSGVVQAVGPGRKIKVLHLLYTPGFGGIESIIINWWKTFNRDEFEVYVACFCGDRDREKPFLEAAEKAGIPVLPVPWTKFKPFLRCAREVARIVREKQIDIIHTHAYYGDAVGALAGKLAGVKTVATVYVWGKYEFHRQIMQFIDWLSIQFMTRVTAHCRDTASRTYVLGKSTRDIQVLLPGYPHRRVPPTAEERRRKRQAAGIADDEILLINAARLAPEKAQDQLLLSFRTIHARYPKTRLWIGGVGLESVEKELHRLRREYGLESAVDFVGFQQDFWSLLDVADMMVHPSHVEGIPQSIMAGMAAGLPIVASDVGGVSEVILQGKTGLIVAENDVDGFTRSVLSLLDNPELAHTLAKAAAHAIETNLSTEAAVAEVENLYRDMLARAR